MRAIEFRGRTVISKRWIFGNLVLSEQSASIYPFKSNTDYNVSKDTVGQYTGLLDKNGTKIFEGDIVSHNDTTRFIQFYEGSFIAKQGGCAQSEQSLINFAPCRTFEVIGNVFENEDLL